MNYKNNRFNCPEHVFSRTKVCYASPIKIKIKNLIWHDFFFQVNYMVCEHCGACRMYLISPSYGVQLDYSPIS